LVRAKLSFEGLMGECIKVTFGKGGNMVKECSQAKMETRGRVFGIKANE
jgi:hypothetical protein